MLFTAYFDEADTHGPSPSMVMAGFLGHARQWELFERKLKNMRDKEGVDIFHGKDIHRLEPIKGMRVVNDLTVLVKKQLTEGMCISLDYQMYRNDYRMAPFPKGIALDSQYGVCFRLLVRSMTNILYQTGQKHKLNVVVERGHKNALNTARVFHETQETLRARGLELLGTWTLASKQEAAPLMAADFLAHTFALMRRPGGIGIEGYANATPEPQKGEAGLTFLEIQPDTLSELKREMQRERWARQAFAKIQKDASKRRLSFSEASGADESPC